MLTKVSSIILVLIKFALRLIPMRVSQR